MARPASDARDRALDAALQILVRDGSSALTIDAVAKEAGVSKGGVLHHFSTKDELSLAIVKRSIAMWETAVEANLQLDPDPIGRYVRAFMKTLAEPTLALLGRGLLGAVALNQALLEPMRDLYRRCQRRIESDGLDPATAYECILIADSLWYQAIFELPQPPPEVLDELRARLERATRQRREP